MSLLDHHEDPQKIQGDWKSKKQKGRKVLKGLTAQKLQPNSILSMGGKKRLFLITILGKRGWTGDKSENTGASSHTTDFDRLQQISGLGAENTFFPT